MTIEMPGPFFKRLIAVFTQFKTEEAK